MIIDQEEMTDLEIDLSQEGNYILLTQLDNQDHEDRIIIEKASVSRLIEFLKGIE